MKQAEYKPVTSQALAAFGAAVLELIGRSESKDAYDFEAIVNEGVRRGLVVELTGASGFPEFQPLPVPEAINVKVSNEAGDNLKAFLTDQMANEAGIYRLEKLYEQLTGEHAPASSGRLMEFMLSHFATYPADILEFRRQC